MFRVIRLEEHQLQEKLDGELFNQARPPEDTAPEPAMPNFCMTDLYVMLPGCDCGPIRIDAFR
ncbi:MAG TPA: hypothetical protein VHS31_19140 [Tepidisphaeraceae bacterium]|jgi:hypothetical protein|nr:hypothetical protein [Tepidisphaeraceae bacterium]